MRRFMQDCPRARGIMGMEVVTEIYPSGIRIVPSQSMTIIALYLVNVILPMLEDLNGIRDSRVVWVSAESILDM